MLCLHICRASVARLEDGIEHLRSVLVACPVSVDARGATEADGGWFAGSGRVVDRKIELTGIGVRVECV